MADKETAKEWFERGYKYRELDTREDSRAVNSIINRVFETMWQNQTHD